MSKLHFDWPSLQSSVLHDPSEISVTVKLSSTLIQCSKLDQLHMLNGCFIQDLIQVSLLDFILMNPESL